MCRGHDLSLIESLGSDVRSMAESGKTQQPQKYPVMHAERPHHVICTCQSLRIVFLNVFFIAFRPFQRHLHMALRLQVLLLYRCVEQPGDFAGSAERALGDTGLLTRLGIYWHQAAIVIPCIQTLESSNPTPGCSTGSYREAIICPDVRTWDHDG